MLAEQRIGAALVTRATAKRAPKAPTVFRPFADQQLAIEIQLVMRPGPKPPALQAFTDTVEKMKERIGQKPPSVSGIVRMPQSA